MEEKLKVKELHRTCCACPSQWEGMTDDNKFIYVRYRWGYFSFSVDNKEVYGVQYGEDMDGEMDDIAMLVICMKFCDFSYIEKLVKE